MSTTPSDLIPFSEAPFIQEEEVISPMSNISKDDIIIAVMGATGAGKTSLISTLTGEKMDIGHDLKSRTIDIMPICCEHPTFPGKRLVFLDTPGFDDTYRSDSDILESIALWLSVTFSEGVKLSGILYLTRISDNNMSAISLQNLKLFRDLCGVQSLANVILVTTMWGDVSEAVGARRETDLIAKWWKPLVMDGAQVARFHNTSNDGWFIVGMLKDKDAIVLRIQDELVNEKKALLDTEAGRRIEDALNATSKRYTDELEAIKAELERVKAENVRQDNRIQALMEEKERLDRSLGEAKRELQRLRKPRGFLNWFKRRWVSRRS